jgi:branched-chain amino acid transport system permease protein
MTKTAHGRITHVMTGRNARYGGRKELAVFTLIFLAGVVIPFLLGSKLTYTLLTQSIINALLATSVGFLVRQNGLVSFGHAAFFGVSCYFIALAVKHNLMQIELAILAAIAIPFVMAVILGFLFRKLIGVAFSMLSLAIAQAIYELVMKWRSLANGEDGVSLDLPKTIFGIDSHFFQAPETMYYTCWVILCLCIFGLWKLVNSHFGTLTIAIRENEERTHFLGYRTIFPRAIIYGISAAIAAIAGVLFVIYNGYVTPETLNWSLSGEILIMAIIGGTRSVWGPALGAIVFFLLKGSISDFTEYWQAILGVCLVIVIVTTPDGISGIIKKISLNFFGGKK